MNLVLSNTLGIFLDSLASVESESVTKVEETSIFRHSLQRTVVYLEAEMQYTAQYHKGTHSKDT